MSQRRERKGDKTYEGFPEYLKPIRENNIAELKELIAKRFDFNIKIPNRDTPLRLAYRFAEPYDKKGNPQYDEAGKPRYEILETLLPHINNLEEINELFQQAIVEQRYDVARVLATRANFEVLNQHHIPEKGQRETYGFPVTYLEHLCLSSNPHKFDLINSILQPVNGTYPKISNPDFLHHALVGQGSLYAKVADQKKPDVYNGIKALYEQQKALRDQKKMLERAGDKAGVKQLKNYLVSDFEKLEKYWIKLQAVTATISKQSGHVDQELVEHFAQVKKNIPTSQSQFFTNTTAASSDEKDADKKNTPSGSVPGGRP